MRNSILIAFLFLHLPFNSIAQNQTFNSEENYSKLRRELTNALLPSTPDSAFVKYSGYSFVVKYGKEIEFSFSDSTPSNVIRKSNRINSDGKSFLIERINEFIEREGIILEEDHLIFYTVLLIWIDRVERENNLEKVIENLYDEGKKFSNSSTMRIEKPIVINIKFHG